MPKTTNSSSLSSVASGKPPPMPSLGLTAPPPELPPIQCPAALLCQVCQFPFSNPQVMPCCGLDVCKVCAVDELVDGFIRGGNKTKKCWSCKAEILIKDLIDNHSMRKRVDAWKKENPR